jgi:hypothetical protein
VKALYLTIASFFITNNAFAAESSVPDIPLDLTHHIIGYLAVLFTVSAYVTAMMEDVIDLRKYLLRDEWASQNSGTCL